MGGMAAMVAGLLAAGAPEAESRSTTLTDNVVHQKTVVSTVKTPEVIPTTADPRMIIGWTPDNIEPAAGDMDEGAYVTHNIYDVRHVNGTLSSR